MIWDKTKKGILEVGEEKVTFEIKVPSALEMEEIISSAELDDNGRMKLKDSEIVRKFLTRIDGFESVEDFLSCGQTMLAMKAIGGFIMDAATLKVEIKN
jgi:hypothetical protein